MEYIQGFMPNSCQLKGNFTRPAYHTDINFLFTSMTTQDRILHHAHTQTFTMKNYVHTLYFAEVTIMQFVTFVNPSGIINDQHRMVSLKQIEENCSSINPNLYILIQLTIPFPSSVRISPLSLDFLKNTRPEWASKIYLPTLLASYVIFLFQKLH